MSASQVGQKKGGIFYGWWIVLACFASTVYGSGTNFYGFGAFFDPLVKEFGWSRAAISVAFSLRSLETGIVAPIVGFIVDKVGPRKLMLLGSIVAATGLFLLSRVNSLFTFYLAFLVVAIGFSASFGLVGMTAVANWFRRKRGLALGILTAGAGLGGIIIPVIIWLINSYGWRTSLVILAVTTLLVGIPLASLVRHKPEPYGYLPDGDAQPLPPASPADASVTPVEQLSSIDEDFSLKEALSTHTFWVVAVSLAGASALVNAMTAHIIPFFNHAGFAGLAGFMAAALPLSSIAGRVGFGWLGDHIDKRYVLTITFLIQAAGIILLAYAWSFWLYIPALALLGPGYGGSIALRGAIQADYFGRKAFGSIQGATMAVIVVLSLPAPIFVGAVVDSTGSYQIPFLVLGLITLTGVPLILSVKRPRRTRQPGL